MKHWKLIAALSTFALSGCSSDTVKNTLGLDRAAPDEYRVVSRPPLSVPPQFSLRPPSNSELPPSQVSASKQGQAIVLGGSNANGTPATTKAKANTSAKTNGADSQFLKNVGASTADPNIRSALTEQRFAVQEQKEETSWWNFWDGADEKKDPTVDAKKESERIQKTEDAGQPVTTGDTPDVKGRDTGVLGRIFGY